jgi:hypothetical protein
MKEREQGDDEIDNKMDAKGILEKKGKKINIERRQIKVTRG